MTATEPTESRLGHDRANAVFFENIQQTFDKIGVSPDESIIVGSQVLAAYGIRPAKDLDTLVGPQTFIEIHKGERTQPDITVGSQAGEHRPGVISLSWDENGLQRTADVICRYDPSSGVSIEEAQQAFNDRILTETISAGGLHFTTLDDTVQYMQEHPHYNYGQTRGKTAKDLQLIRELVTNGTTVDAPVQLDSAAAENISALFKKSRLRKMASAIIKH